MTMSGTHTEAVLKTEATLGSQVTDLSKEIKDALIHCKKLEEDIAVVRTVSDRLVERVVKTEKQCWENV